MKPPAEGLDALIIRLTHAAQIRLGTTPRLQAGLENSEYPAPFIEDLVQLFCRETHQKRTAS